jgi:hypothetical protein
LDEKYNLTLLQSGAVTALTFGVAFSGFAISGYNVNHLGKIEFLLSIFSVLNLFGAHQIITSPKKLDLCLNFYKFIFEFFFSYEMSQIIVKTSFNLSVT